MTRAAYTPLRPSRWTLALSFALAASTLLCFVRFYQTSIQLPRCILVAENDHGLGGLGDYFKLTYRSIVVSKAAGCAYRSASWESEHGYDPSSYFSVEPTSQLVNTRVCDVRTRVLGDLTDDQGDFCALTPNTTVPECGIYRYKRATKHLIDHKFLQCSGDYYSRTFLGRPDLRIDKTRCSKYIAMHKRAGDLAGAAGCNNRVASITTINAAAAKIKSRHPDISDECYYVLTEGEMGSSAPGLNFTHTVLSDGSADTVLATMAEATVLFGAQSGLIHAATRLFKGREMVIPGGAAVAMEQLADGRFQVFGVENLCALDRPSEP
jgi:hypothetical protein